MKSYTNLRTTFGKLSLNSSTENLALFDELANTEHRYLLQKYFSNQVTYSMTTQGGQSLSLTGALSIGATSATLTSVWTGNTTKVQFTFSSGEIRMVSVISNSASVSWDAPLLQTATTSVTVGGQQFYPLPPNYSKMISLTIQIGSLKWTPNEVFTVQEWNQLNVFPYYADIPQNIFIFPGGDHSGQVGIWPIPATTGNIITFTYKYRVPDLSIVDYTTPGTLSITSKTNTITGSGTSLGATTNIGTESRWIKFDQPTGDNLWYQIASIPSSTSILLYQPYQGNSIVNTSTYTIGQMPLLMEDFQDMLLYKPLFIYYSTINKDMEKANNFEKLYNERLALLQEYSGNNSTGVNLRNNINMRNPNTFQQNIGGSPS